MAFGKEFSDQDAHFIAGGRTLELIRKYEEDERNAKDTVENLRQELGASFLAFPYYYLFDHEIADPRFVLDDKDKKSETRTYVINNETPEGRAFQERVDDIPHLSLTFKIFARRLTGAEEIHTNPDHLKDSASGSSHSYGEYATTAATYRKYGDVYVVSVPRVIHGVFNEASQALDKQYHFDGKRARMSDGYRYDWFTPPDSEPIPYSKVIELREKELGSQTEPRAVKAEGIVSSPPRPNR